jgi:hypothetical protein
MLGVSPRAQTGRDSLDQQRPRVLQSVPSTMFNHPDWDPVNSAFAADIRPPVGSVETWTFDVRTTLRVPVQLAFESVNAVPDQFQVYLVDVNAARSTDLREGGVYTFTPATLVSNFKVVVGTPEEVRKVTDQFVPKEFSLGYNFPNPFNPETTIPVSVPKTSNIKLEVFNILGQRVRVLYDGPIETGRYWFRWNGRNEGGNVVATGVYLARLTTGSGLSFIRKMALVK